jgi:presenilin-like A22 family membrane protease
MVLKPTLFLKEVILFSTTLLLGIFSAHNYSSVVEKGIIEPSFSWDNIIFFLIFAVVFYMIVLRFKRVGAVFFKFLLTLIVFSGSQLIFGSIVSSPWDLALALGLVLVFILIRNVLVHNIGMILGIAGVSSMLGITISPLMAVALLGILSFYDILAVYWTKHMVYLAKGMMESGAIFGFIIPFDLRDIFYHSHEAKHKIGEKFMILGSGDIGLPLVLSSSIATVSIGQALVICLFTLAGLLVTHLIFINQSGRRPMAALPPIATLTIISSL